MAGRPSWTGLIAALLWIVGVGRRSVVHGLQPGLRKPRVLLVALLGHDVAVAVLPDQALGQFPPILGDLVHVLGAVLRKVLRGLLRGLLVEPLSLLLNELLAREEMRIPPSRTTAGAPGASLSVVAIPAGLPPGVVGTGGGIVGALFLSQIHAVDRKSVVRERV